MIKFKTPFLKTAFFIRKILIADGRLEIFYNNLYNKI